MIPFRDGQTLPGADKHRETLRRCIEVLLRMEEKRKKEPPPTAGKSGIVVIPLTEELKPRDVGPKDWDI